MATPPDVTVRELRREDLEALWEMLNHRYDERAEGRPIWTTMFLDRPPREKAMQTLEATFHQVQDGSAVVVVAERGGRVVGFCQVCCAVPGAPSEQSHVGELGMFVHCDHRGQGIGTALLERCLASARPRFEVVFLSVWTKNEVAVRMYRRFGFSVCAHLPRVIRRGGEYFDEERMVLDFGGTPGVPGENR
jgi:ribosomal protein S18 acetylase RimI-like enzyme